MSGALQNVLTDRINELSNSIANLTDLVNVLKPAKKFRYKVRNCGSTLILFDDDISYIEYSDKHSVYHCKVENKIPAKLILSKKLQEIEETLNPDVFVRCFKSYIVNVNFIRKFKKDKKGRGGSIYLIDGTEIPYSDNFSDQLLERGIID